VSAPRDESRLDEVVARDGAVLERDGILICVVDLISDGVLMLYCEDNIASGDEESMEIILAICGMVPCVVGVVALLILSISIFDAFFYINIVVIVEQRQ